MDRRDVLKLAQRASVGALCAAPLGLLAGCSSVRYVAYRQEGERLVVNRATVGMAPYVLLRHPRDGEPPIYLHRREDGSFAAVLLRCTHRGCQVNPAGVRLACPCHGSEFTATGEVLEGPAERPLQSFDVTTDADHITLHLV
ncbi:MAG: Rieske (2Fe-2S) protein [Rhodothermaceae bacterium]|nr:Rieske (2Fe-2S) protein [Rhodothermaceae bacterium]